MFTVPIKLTHVHSNGDKSEVAVNPASIVVIEDHNIIASSSIFDAAVHTEVRIANLTYGVVESRAEIIDLIRVSNETAAKLFGDFLRKIIGGGANCDAKTDASNKGEK